MTPKDSIPNITPDVAVILADVARLGISLQVHVDSEGGKLRFRPRSAMTPDLARRIMARRVELMAALADTTWAVDATASPGEAESVVSSVVSESDRGSCEAVAAPPASRPPRFHRFQRDWAPSLPRLRVGEVVWQARQAGDLARAWGALDLWHETMTEAVGRGMPRPAAELLAGGRVLDMAVAWRERLASPNGGGR